jgi:hypothetical protein
MCYFYGIKDEKTGRTFSNIYKLKVAAITFMSNSFKKRYFLETLGLFSCSEKRIIFFNLQPFSKNKDLSFSIQLLSGFGQ